MNDERLDLSGLLMRERVRARLVGAPARPLRVGRFELRRVCGGGGEGLVHEAWDTQAKASVALKCLNSVRAGEQAALQREFRALSHLVHPNLVAMHELFCVDGAWFFTMELISGIDIVSFARAQPDRPRAIRMAIAQLLRGLAAIHGAGFVHRDVKPSNVLVEASGRVVLVDFGLVIPQARAVHMRGGAGTPAYMAPEQAAGAPPDAAADLYGVGAIIFELLTGSRFDTLNATRADGTELALPGSGSLVGDTARDLAALCRALLARCPAARPCAAEALLRLATEREVPRVYGLPREPPTCFVARTVELARLHRALSRSAAGEPRILLVHGESGIGKSALLAHFADDLRARSAALIFSGRCYERESTPYKVFDELVAGLLRHLNALPDARARALTADLSEPLQQLFPAFAPHARSQVGQRRAPSEHSKDARPRAFAALRELLCRVAAETPVVLTIDDLQWGDLDSALLLEALFVRTDRLPLLLVGSYRSGEAETSPFLKKLLCARGLGSPAQKLEQLALGALSPDEARALVAQLTPLSVASPLLESAHGIPFLLVEAALSEAGPARRASDSADVGALFAGRVDRTSAPAQALLAVLSVAGRPLSVALATRAVAGLERGFETALELASLRLARFRDIDGERCLEPYHDRVRDLIAARLSAARARALHLAIACAMESLGTDDPLRQVEHLCAAGERTRAAQLAVRAAEQASVQHAWTRAADLLVAALEMGAPDDSSLHRRLATALSFAGRNAESAAAYMRAAHGADVSERAELERLAARQYVRAGHTQAGRSLLERALLRSGGALPRSQGRAVLALFRSRVWSLVTETAWRARGRAGPSATAPLSERARDRLATLDVFHQELSLVHPIQSALAHSWYCREALRGSRHDRVKALTSEVVLLALADGPAARAPTSRLLKQASALSDASGAPYDTALLLYATAVAAIHADWRPRAAIAPLMRAEALLRERCPGTQVEQVWVAMALEHALEVTGQLVAFTRNVRAREQSEQAAQTRSFRVVSAPVVLLLEDQPEQAFQLVAEHMSARREILPLIDLIAFGRGTSALLYSGEAGRARDYYASQRRRLGFQLVLRSRVVAESEQFQLARIAAALYWTTRDKALRREVERRVAHARRLPPLAWAQFRLLEASVARCDGRLAECRALLRAASTAFGEAGGEHGVWCARYREAQLDQSAERLAHARGYFTAQGVRDPERWVSLGIPGCGDWG